jgi:predicted Zn-dependent protease
MNLRLPSAVFSVMLLTACATSPTGQRQLKLFPEGEMAQMGATAFESIKKEDALSTNRAAIRYVQCVAGKVTGEVRDGRTWEVRVFADDQANAFALPGGKIGVYEGMLKVAANQHQLAAVIGHEITHVTADHGNARMSAAYATQAGLQLASALGGGDSPVRQQLLGLLGVGAQYGVLMPYGRGQESEADVIGLNLMARAGFDPREAVALWQNMRDARGSGPPVFLSTHPSPEGRIATLKEHMPEALTLYREARRAGKTPSCK